MPIDSQFSVADVLSRGLAAVPDILDRLPDSAGASRADVDLVVKDAFDRADVVGLAPGLVDAILVATDPLGRATALIAAKYADLGGGGGVLGATSGAVSACPDGFGYYRHFRHGSIFWHPAAGAHEVHGPIRAKWAALGWERSVLGYPTSDQKVGSDDARKGAYNTFQGGAIHWYPVGIGGLVSGFDRLDSTVTATVLGSGGVRGGALGTLGAGTVAAAASAGAATVSISPVASEASGTLASAAATSLAASSAGSSRLAFSAVDTAALEVGELVGRLSDIGDRTTVVLPGDQATVLGSDAGAFEVHGAIGIHYRALGGSGSVLGYPTTDETATPDGRGRFNHFQAGSIYWTSATGAHEVHGLISAYWASAGYERNAALGYPITDELIPDRRIGHRFPELKKKLGLPPDVIKLPAEAVLSGFSPAVSNLPVGDVVVVPDEAAASPARGAATRRAARTALSGATVSRAASSARAAATEAIVASSAASRVGEAVGGLRPGVGSILHIDPDLIAARSPSSPAPTSSPNRFGDFENGVVFWKRGATAARPLQPWASADDGRSMRRTPAEVVAAFETLLKPALAGMNGATYGGAVFTGVTGYSYDGASVHNRAHRLRATVRATQSIGGLLGTSVDVPVDVPLELHVETAYAPDLRSVVVYLAGWSVASMSGLTASPPLERQLHPRLDTLLYKRAGLIEIPDTNGGEPIALLSAKTLTDGSVVVFIEPDDPLVVVGTVDRITDFLPHLGVLHP
ncbi:LGFP repeat-containing protein [Demequina rhizosphaerae]|uniref:LGFP repeat-containing protein n=1 Tax=Demequina rhizosphaerae TaxID=1638985 RepID=UPI000784F9F3|nr:hypothetical protein [Demequina rhizosphaerae]